MTEQLHQFVHVRAELQETLNRFPADRTEEVLFNTWRLKDVLAHIIGWDLYFTELVRRLKANDPIAHYGDINAFNAASVAQRAGRTWPEVYAEWIGSSAAFSEEYGNLDECWWNTPVSEAFKLTPALALKINIEHYEEHLAKIQRSR